MQRDPLVTRNDKATAEQFDSVATQIATIGTEAKLEDSSPVMGIVEVPVFPYVGLRQWISWMEHYFARKGLNEFEKLHMADGFIEGEPAKYLASIEKYFPIRSWEELKTKLIWEFGADDDQEKIIMKARRARSHEAFLTWKAEKRRDSSLCSELVKTKITSPVVAEVNEEELEIQNDSLPDREQEDDVQCAISVSSCVEQSELTSSTVEDVNVTFGNCIEIELLKKTANEEDVSADLETGLGCAPAAMESMQSADSDSVMEDELQITKPSDTEVSEEKSVEVITELSQNLTEISHPAMVETGCVYTDGLSFVLQPHSFAAEQTSVKYMLWFESIEEGCRVLNGFRMRFEKLLFNVYLSFWEVDRVDGEFHLKHKWRSKQLNRASVLKLVLEQAVCGRPELLYGQKFIEFGTGLNRIRDQIWNQFITVTGSRGSLEYQLRWRLHQGLKRYMRSDHSSIWHRWRYKTLGSAAVFHNGVVSERSHLVHESTVLDHQVWHRWRFKKSEALEVWSPELLSQNVPSLILFILQVLSLVHVAERLRAWIPSNSVQKLEFDDKRFTTRRTPNMSLLLYNGWIEDILRSLMRLTFGDSKFQVKHRWKFKQLTSVSGLALNLEQVVAENCSILSTVQKRLLSVRHHNLCSMLREHKRVVCRWVCSDFSVIVTDTRSELLRPLLSFLCSSLRASLFSRGEVYKRVLIGLLMVKVLIWWFAIANKSDFLKKLVTKQWEETELSRHWMVHGEFHKSLEERSSLLLQVKIHLLLFLIQQEQQWKKIYKSRMFKYKEKEETSAATFAICRSYKTCKNEAMKSPILIFSMSISSFFSSSKLVGKLVFMGEVLIDINLSSHGFGKRGG
ncbi:hypothetical protein Bca4012_056768 [Brassica carinata]